MEWSTIGDICRNKRKCLSYTQERLSEAAGVSVTTIHRLEKGHVIKFESLHKIAYALGMRLDVEIDGIRIHDAG